MGGSGGECEEGMGRKWGDGGKDGGMGAGKGRAGEQLEAQQKTEGLRIVHRGRFAEC